MRKNIVNDFINDCLKTTSETGSVDHLRWNVIDGFMEECLNDVTRPCDYGWMSKEYPPGLCAGEHISLGIAAHIYSNLLHVSKFGKMGHFPTQCG